MKNPKFTTEVNLQEMFLRNSTKTMKKQVFTDGPIFPSPLSLSCRVQCTDVDNLCPVKQKFNECFCFQILILYFTTYVTTMSYFRVLLVHI